MKEIIRKLKYLFYRYVLGHTYNVGWDYEGDYGTAILVRIDKKGNMFIEDEYHSNIIK